MEFTKADLVWEAVRRNEEFKKDLEEYQKNIIKKSNRLVHKDDVYFEKRWEIGFVPKDCKCSIYDIKQSIKAGESPYIVHPYYDLFSYDSIPVMHKDLSDIKIIQFSDDDHEAYLVEGNARRLKRFLNDSRGRIVLSIDPLAADATVFDKIKKITKLYKENVIENEQSDFYSHIGWLEDYDYFLKYIKDNYDQIELNIISGAYQRPEDLKDSQLVSPKKMREKKEQIKQYYLANLLKLQFKNEYDDPEQIKPLPSNFKKNLKKLETSELPDLIVDRLLRNQLHVITS